MADKKNDIKIIGFALAILYTVSIFISANFLGIVYDHGFLLLMVALFVFTLAASIAVIKLEEWGRKLLVGLNAIFLVIFKTYTLKIYNNL